MHDRMAEVGAWLRKVVLGYYQYHAVPGNTLQLRIFKRRVCRLWQSVLVRRSQRAEMRGERLFCNCCFAGSSATCRLCPAVHDVAWSRGARLTLYGKTIDCLRANRVRSAQSPRERRGRINQVCLEQRAQRLDPETLGAQIQVRFHDLIPEAKSQNSFRFDLNETTGIGKGARFEALNYGK
jgi:hypothetical protein